MVGRLDTIYTVFENAGVEEKDPMDHYKNEE